MSSSHLRFLKVGLANGTRGVFSQDLTYLQKLYFGYYISAYSLAKLVYICYTLYSTKSTRSASYYSTNTRTNLLSLPDNDIEVLLKSRSTCTITSSSRSYTSGTKDMYDVDNLVILIGYVTSQRNRSRNHRESKIIE